MVRIRSGLAARHGFWVSLGGLGVQQAGTDELMWSMVEGRDVERIYIYIYIYI